MPDYEMNTGYLLDEESELKDEFLSSVPEDDALGDETIDEEYLPDSRMENQARMNSCVGHGLTTVQEHLAENGLKVSGSDMEHKTYSAIPKRQFSRMFGYLTSQERSGIRGDRGAYIQGAITAAKKDGCVSEDLFPYPSSYSNRVEQSIRDEARKILLLNHYKLTPDPYDACRHLHRRRGIILGIPWKESFANERDDRITTVQGRTLGGHCVCSIGYKYMENNWWVRLTNSHGSRWAKAGHSFVHPKVWEWMVQNGVVLSMEGLTLESDDIDWSSDQNNPFA